MTPEQVEPFPDNWTYLKAELNWLDRLLSLAVAKQRKDAKEIERVSRSRVDRATSHWWKGLVSLEGEPAADSPADLPPRKPATKTSYHQQLDARIQASQHRGIFLGLPTLCQRLRLSSFEKNLVLMALAPEINQRYSRLYSYLQDADSLEANGLPTVDLVLRLLCRTDAEWRSARDCLIAGAPLMQSGLIDLLAVAAEPLLARPVKLADALVDFLLADEPQPLRLEGLFSNSGGSPFACWLPPLPTGGDPWSDLIVPESLQSALKHLCDRLRFAPRVDTDWGFANHTNGLPAGSAAWFVGASGTGKTTAAQTIARHLNLPLYSADLQHLSFTTQQKLLHQAAPAPILLLHSAQVWFGRSPTVERSTLLQWLHLRQQTPQMTLLSVETKQQLTPYWQRQLQPLLEFPLPNQSRRMQLWQRAFPANAPIAAIDWQLLAQEFRFTGGEMRRVARDAAIRAAAAGTSITMAHVREAGLAFVQTRKR
jgi:hypothetical protein